MSRELIRAGFIYGGEGGKGKRGRDEPSDEMLREAKVAVLEVR